jgi:hypothetical protein
MAMWKPTIGNMRETWNVGHVEAPFAALVALFGEPNGEESGDGKVSTEWVVENEAGVQIRIYDYRETPPAGWRQSEVRARRKAIATFRARPSYRWHLGGSDPAAAEALGAWIAERLASTAG